ncbi:MAG: serine hydrolase domain-containing protein, partial [Deefgea sp.]
MHSADCPAIKPAAMINQAQLQTKVDQFRRSNDLPGLGVALVQNDEIHCAGSGQQRIDSAALIQSNETFQLGALNKALTATLVARWVEQGKLRWDSTLADLLPAWREQMCTEYQTVTLLQLLQHRAGLPRDLSDMNYPNLLAILGGNTFADRSTAARWILQQAHVSQINQTSR